METQFPLMSLDCEQTQTEPSNKNANSTHNSNNPKSLTSRDDHYTISPSPHKTFDKACFCHRTQVNWVYDS